MHPNEPWMLVSLYNGNVHVWNYESQVKKEQGNDIHASFLIQILSIDDCEDVRSDGSSRYEVQKLDL